VFPKSSKDVGPSEAETFWSSFLKQRLIGAVLLEQNDEWQLMHRYRQVEAMAELLVPAADLDQPQIPPKAA
jgi:hypothetical protein